MIKTKVKSSPIEGRGLFSNEAVARGSVVGHLGDGCKFISENDYRRAQEKWDEYVIHSGVRLVGSSFIYVTPTKDKYRCTYRNEYYINHSFSPTLLYHCGILFAERDLARGEELTVNYRYFLVDYDLMAFRDTVTGRRVEGMRSDDALLKSTLELTDLLTQRIKRTTTVPLAATKPRRPSMQAKPG